MESDFGPDSFKVVDGIMVVNSTGNGPHLVYTGEGFDAKYKDFELIVEAKADPNSNSGIYFHTDGTFQTPKGLLYSGYEAQLNTTAKEKRKPVVCTLCKMWLNHPSMNPSRLTMRIKVKGKRIQICVTTFKQQITPNLKTPLAKRTWPADA